MILNFDNLDEYFSELRSISSEMIASAYATITHEPTTIKSIICRLENHPDFRYVLRTWVHQPPSTIQGLQEMSTSAQWMANLITEMHQNTPLFEKLKPRTTNISSFIPTVHAERHQDARRQRRQQPRTFYRFHAELQQPPLLHADSECRNQFYPLGIHGSHQTAQQRRPAPNRRQHEAKVRQANPNRATHVHDVNNDDTPFTGWPQIVLDSAAHPTNHHSPLSSTACNHNPTYTHTATKAHNPITHSGTMLITTQTCPISTTAVIIPHIRETLLSI